MILNMVGGGGGASMNFSVSAFASADALPASASENAIAVITENEITSWIFSATEPESPSSGMVWFSVGLSSPVAFNAAQKNTVMVYPVSASQYIAGVWVTKNAKSFQGGAWVDWWIYGTLYDNGKTDEDLAGGWASYNYRVATGYTGIASTVTIGEASVTATMTAGGSTNRCSFFAHENIIDFSQFNTAHFEFLSASGAGWAKIMVFDSSGTAIESGPEVWATGGTLSGSVDMDISSITDEGRIGVMMWANSNSAVITVEMSLARLS